MLILLLWILSLINYLIISHCCMRTQLSNSVPTHKLFIFLHSPKILKWTAKSFSLQWSNLCFLILLLKLLRSVLGNLSPAGIEPHILSSPSTFCPSPLRCSFPVSRVLCFTHLWLILPLPHCLPCSNFLKKAAWEVKLL